METESRAAEKPEYTLTESPMKTGLKMRCPRCEKGRLFSSYLKLAPYCPVCGLSFSFADPADGPAFFVMSIVAIPAVLLVVWLELSLHVSYWVHLVVTLPFTVLASLILLPMLKGWFVCAEYYHKVKDGRIRLNG